MTPDPKERRITVRLSVDDLARLHREAARAGLSPSTLLRKLLRAAASEKDAEKGGEHDHRRNQSNGGSDDV